MAGTIVLPPIKSNQVQIASPSAAPAASPTPVPVRDYGLFADTPFAHYFNAITTYQVQEEALEAKAAKTILQYSRECR